MSEKSMRLLAAAVIERAVTDWRKAVSLLDENPDYQYALEIKYEVEEFFAGQWFALLCDINPDFTKIHLQEMRG
ncbi:MAG TPA: hypothetical protein VJ863_01025 [Sphaerochaeta sp.]|nr:hypothetical protein [Sphaerochaeta sp.]